MSDRKQTDVADGCDVSDVSDAGVTGEGSLVAGFSAGDADGELSATGFSVGDAVVGFWIAGLFSGFSPVLLAEGSLVTCFVGKGVGSSVTVGPRVGD